MLQAGHDQHIYTCMSNRRPGTPENRPSGTKKELCVFSSYVLNCCFYSSTHSTQQYVFFTLTYVLSTHITYYSLLSTRRHPAHRVCSSHNLCSFYSSTSSTPSVRVDSCSQSYKLCGHKTTTHKYYIVLQ